jgi:hypothetical protein
VQTSRELRWDECGGSFSVVDVDVRPHGASMCQVGQIVKRARHAVAVFVRFRA